MGVQFSLEGSGDVPYVVVHVTHVFVGKRRRDDATHAPMF